MTVVTLLMRLAQPLLMRGTWNRHEAGPVLAPDARFLVVVRAWICLPVLQRDAQNRSGTEPTLALGEAQVLLDVVRTWICLPALLHGAQNRNGAQPTMALGKALALGMA